MPKLRYNSKRTSRPSFVVNLGDEVDVDGHIYDQLARHPGFEPVDDKPAKKKAAAKAD